MRCGQAYPRAHLLASRPASVLNLAADSTSADVMGGRTNLDGAVVAFGPAAVFSGDVVELDVVKVITGSASPSGRRSAPGSCDGCGHHTVAVVDAVEDPEVIDRILRRTEYGPAGSDPEALLHL